MSTRVVFCTYPGLYSSAALRPLLESREVDVVGVVCSTRQLSRRYGTLRNALAFARWSGWRYVGYHLSVTDLFNVLQAFAKRKGVRAACRANGIPCHATEDINAPTSLRFLREVRPDLLVSAYFNQLIGPAARGVPALGGVNIHPSLLPRFRGTDPVLHALLESMPSLGVSVHYLDERFDTGNLLRQAARSCAPGASMLACYDALFEQGARLALDALPQIRAGWPGIAQPAGGEYVGWPNRDVVGRFRREGRALATLGDYLGALAK